jgi:glycosyltransferase involved in cell wall biosynthesis
MRSRRLAILADYPEEGWASMDLCAAKLEEGLQRGHTDRFAVQKIHPPYRRRLEHLAAGGRNIDRLLNRFHDYPRHVRWIRKSFDLFHLADHSYAQLLLDLPAGNAGAYCHDLDTFKCLLNPQAEPRPRWFKAMARRILRGFEKAAIIFHSTQAVREQLLRYHLADTDKLVMAPLGVSEEFFVAPPDQKQAQTPQAPYILHVGSSIPRKRLDVLLNVFAAIRDRHPDLRLIQVGGVWTDAHRHLIHQHELADRIVQTPRLPTGDIAELYRGADVVMQTSEAEGFGLPVIEALACGATVLASDIPSLREVGGPAVCYAPVADIDAWAQALHRLLNDPTAGPALEQRLEQAAKYTWSNHCQIIADAYERLIP